MPKIMKMKPVLLHELLLPSAVLFFAICIQGSQSSCIDLNFQAAALQGGDACKLFNSILDDGDDLFVADITDIEATCGGGVTTNMGMETQHICVDGVVDVVAGINEEGCGVTGGTVVSNFIQKVDQSQEIFSLLTQLACKQIDGVSCYTAIQDAIGYCYQGIENCLGRVPCDCALDFIAFVERLETDDNAFLMQSYTKLDDSSIGIIKGAEFSCRCELLDSLLEDNPSCSLFNTIIKEGDLLAGSNTTRCESNTTQMSCIDDIIYVANGLSMDDCPVTTANASFITSLDDTNDILFAISDFACDQDCYIALQNCQMNETLCEEESLSCDCIIKFKSILDSLSSSSKSDLFKFDDTTMPKVQESFRRCECAALNNKATMLKNETYCSLYDSMIRDGSIFVGDVNNAQSTCVQQYACIGNVTEVVETISNTSGCDLQQDTDELAQFFYVLENSRSDLETMANFICNREVCYNDIRAVVVGCRGTNSIESCTKSSTTPDCFDAFFNMVDNMTLDGRDDFIGANLTILKSIKAGEELREKNEASFLSGIAWMHVILLLCVVCMVNLR